MKLKSTYIILNIDFQLINDLIYYIKQSNARLCVSTNCIKNVFEIIHDLNAHAKHHKAYVRLIDIVYIHKLSKQFIIYIKHCSFCQLNQTAKHKFYNELVSISTLYFLYHIVKIDFIVALLKQLHECDVVLTITNKKIRKHIFISKKFI